MLGAPAFSAALAGPGLALRSLLKVWGRGWRGRRLARGQLLAKERHQCGVEFGMESHAIESRLVGADRGHDARIRTRRQEG
mgnify:CR=1 FL=1